MAELQAFSWLDGTAGRRSNDCQLLNEPNLAGHRRLPATPDLIGAPRKTAFGCREFNEMLSALNCALAFNVLELAKKVSLGFRTGVPRTIAIELAA